MKKFKSVIRKLAMALLALALVWTLIVPTNMKLWAAEFTYKDQILTVKRATAILYVGGDVDLQYTLLNYGLCKAGYLDPNTGTCYLVNFDDDLLLYNLELQGLFEGPKDLRTVTTGVTALTETGYVTTKGTETSYLTLDEVKKVIAGNDDPSKDDPSKDDPSKDDPSKDDPSKDDPSKDDPSKDDPSKDDPSKDDPSKDDPSKDDPSKDDPSQDDPSKDDPSQDDPSKDDPSQDDPSKDDPSQDDPSKDDPSKDDPSKDDPSQDDPSKDDPSKDDPSKDDPSKDDPTQPVAPIIDENGNVIVVIPETVDATYVLPTSEIGTVDTIVGPNNDGTVAIKFTDGQLFIWNHQLQQGETPAKLYKASDACTRLALDITNGHIYFYEVGMKEGNEITLDLVKSLIGSQDVVTAQYKVIRTGKGRRADTCLDDYTKKVEVQKRHNRAKVWFFEANGTFMKKTFKKVNRVEITRNHEVILIKGKGAKQKLILIGRDFTKKVLVDKTAFKVLIDQTTGFIDSVILKDGNIVDLSSL